MDTSTLGVSMASPNNEQDAAAKKKCCSSGYLYDGNQDAMGYSWLGSGRGMITMANIFISASFLELANQAAGCEVGEVCKNKIYGFYPSSWITNIPVIAGLASAFVMPICGALVDFTPYRREIGIVTAVVLILIQAVQIYTVERTWFTMMMLQAVAVVFYFLQLVSLYAYLPDIARQVGEMKMARFTANFQMVQFSSQAFFLIVIIAIGLILKPAPTTVQTGQISQGLNTFSSIVLLGTGWFKYMQTRLPVRKLPQSSSMLAEGFRNNWSTTKAIQKYYKKGMRWFFIAITFGQASTQAITSVAVVYLTDSLELDSTETGIFFLAVLLMGVPGCEVGRVISQKTNPNTSYKIVMLYIFVVLSIGALILEYLPGFCVYIWGLFMGIGLGWYYTVDPLFFAMILPKGQEAELAGFYMYCTQILSWLPPLAFTLATEANVAQKYAVIITASFLLLSIALLMCSGTWEEILAEADLSVAQHEAIAESTKLEDTPDAVAAVKVDDESS